MLKLDDILSKVATYHPQADLDLVRKAYHYSKKAHHGQKRKSGQPFLVHPLEVADILAEMKLDASSVAAGILHDTIEDTASTKDEIKSLFGDEIAELVDGVTKLTKLHFSSQEDQQAENFRKMILAMSRDIRVILIKLADRLNNLRTLQFMPEEKQTRIAQETFDIYAPLANRLGMQWMKVQLEDLSFRFLKPDIYREIEKKISRMRKNKDQYTARVVKAIQGHFKDAIKDFEISGRMKHVYSIFQKMERLNITFEQVHDLMAFRILTHSVEECYEALGLLHSIWKPVPGRFKDYLAMPKENNYQSLHTTVICLDANRVEFQIRTFEMHEIAEKGIAAHWRYKEDGQLDLESQMTFDWLRQLVGWQKELKDSIEFMDTVKLDLFSSEIYVFTPKGDVRALPHRSTPIDFAYSIHTDVGTHCRGAKVNGRIVPLDYEIESGDEIEIITSKQARPSKDWLKMVITSRAKARIRQFLKEEQRQRSIELGQNLFEEECKKTNVDAARFLASEELKQYLQKKGVVGEPSFYAAIAYGKISLPVLFDQLMPDHKASEDGILTKIFKKVTQQNKGQVLVGGLDDVMITFGKCCSPIPGDRLIGFVTRGRGVTLHRVECPKVPEMEPERRVSATWNKNVEGTRTARLTILCEDKPGMLADIAKTISEKKVNITKAIVRAMKDEKAVIYLSVQVKQLTELAAIMKSTQKIKGVMTIERELG